MNTTITLLYKKLLVTEGCIQEASPGYVDLPGKCGQIKQRCLTSPAIHTRLLTFTMQLFICGIQCFLSTFRYINAGNKPSSVPSGASLHSSIISLAEKQSSPGGQEVTDVSLSTPNHTSPVSRGVGGVFSCL